MFRTLYDGMPEGTSLKREAKGEEGFLPIFAYLLTSLEIPRTFLLRHLE